MILSAYNIEVVPIENQMYRLRPINNCIINGKIYISNNKEYIPTEQLMLGCVMSMQHQKKSWIILMKEFFEKWCIEIYEVPYKENADYSTSKILELIMCNTPIFMLPLK